MLNMMQPALAKAAGLGISTVVDFERERRRVSDKAVAAMRRALEAAGIIFIDTNGEGSGVRLTKEAETRLRKGKAGEGKQPDKRTSGSDD